MLGAQQRLFALPSPEARDLLRPYQREDYEAVMRDFAAGNRAVLGVGFCAYGKTTLGAELAKHWPGRVLWIAERGLLLSQARERIELMTGQPCDLEQAHNRAGGNRIVVGSVQTLKGDRLASWKPDWFSLVIVDEAHHSVAKTYRAILGHFADAKVFGLTATPRRHDKIGMHNVFTAEAFKRNTIWGIQNGYFVEPIPIGEFVDSIHLEKIGTTAGDLALSELEDEIAKNAGAIVSASWRHVGHLPTIWFTPGQASAHAVAATINEAKYAPGTAAAVDANTDDVQRKRILRAFVAGELRHITNCGIYGEGADFPHAHAVVWARPTKSEAVYQQGTCRPGRTVKGIGELATREERLTAIARSNKPKYVLVDVSGHAGKHSIAHTVDSLAGDTIKAVRDKANAVLALKPGTTLTEAIDQAEKEIASEDKARKKLIAEAAAAAVVKSRSKAFDPFRRLGVDEREHGIEPEWSAEPPDQDDVLWLKKNNLPVAKATKGTVAALRKQCKAWYASGRAGFKQRNVLSRVGAPVDVSFTQASELITAAYQKGNGRYPTKLSQAQIDGVLSREREPGQEG